MRCAPGERSGLDDDRARVDVEAVSRFRSERSSWARGRSLAAGEALVGEGPGSPGATRTGARSASRRAAARVPAGAPGLATPSRAGEPLDEPGERERVAPGSREVAALVQLEAHDLVGHPGGRERAPEGGGGQVEEELVA